MRTRQRDGGNNTGANPTFSNVALLFPGGINVPAVGNTWQPGVQNAAPQGSVNPPPGRYVVPDGATILEVTGATTGQNYRIGAATTVLHLAEQ